MAIGWWAAMLTTAAAAEGEWRELFNGRNLAGWKANADAGAFTVADGALKAHATHPRNRGHLFFIGARTEGLERFRNFELEAVVRGEPGSNSGIFFHTDMETRDGVLHLKNGYEVQLNSAEKEKRKTGSLYAVVDLDKSPVDETQWFTVAIRVQGDRITVRVNGRTTVDYTEPPGVVAQRPPERKGRVLRAEGGAIALQARSRPLVVGTAIGLAVSLLGIPALDLPWENRWHEILAVYQFAAERLYLEHWPAVAAGLLAALLCLVPLRRAERGAWRPRQGGFLMLLSLAFGVLLIIQVRKADEDAVSLSRNFYGTLQVREILAGDPSGHHYSLVHGRITHGLQFRSAAQRLWPTTYYGESSGIGLALKHLERPEGQRHIGLVGLGTGTLAAYGRAGDRLRIYEINPEVERIARTHFLFLEQTPADVAVVLGDARLTLERELAAGQPQAFDLLALDAFSSDAIPVHLLTQEAMETYLKHLAPGGIIAVHTSNRYLDLQPVVEGLARRLELKVLTITDDDSEFWWIYGTTWMLLAREKEVLEKDAFYERMRAPSERVDAVPLWTDERASLLRILR